MRSTLARCSLDGELVLATKAGIGFYGLRGARRHDDVSLWAFDILELDGADLRGLPLIERTARLAMASSDPCPEEASGDRKRALHQVPLASHCSPTAERFSAR